MVLEHEKDHVSRWVAVVPIAETINRLYKAEVIHRRGPWKGWSDVEFATLEWVNGFNMRRLLEPIGNIPPVKQTHRESQTDCQGKSFR
jgi:hypothetical protein